MLVNTLNTNEVKNSAGTEVEFSRILTLDRRTEYALISEVPSLPYRLIISHVETGVGLKRRRRSLVRFDKTTMSTVDTTLPITTSFYQVLDYPVGAAGSSAEAANVIANGMSFTASLGASTTILYDGTGNGAVTLLSGGL
jgi:hypothetical protein